MPIEQIKIGDKVLSYDEKTKRFEYKTVAQTFIAVKENIVKIKIRGEKLLTTTTEHPFYVKKSYKARDNLTSESDDEEGEWMTAAELKVGQKVLRPDGKWTRITSIEYSSEPTLVYNLEVEGNHNYFVGEIGVLSHNCDFSKMSLDQLKGVYKDQLPLLKKAFGIGTDLRGPEAAQEVLNNLRKGIIPEGLEGLSKDSLLAYREVAVRAIEGTKGDPVGSQVLRVEIIDELLKRLY